MTAQPSTMNLGAQYMAEQSLSPQQRKPTRRGRGATRFGVRDVSLSPIRLRQQPSGGIASLGRSFGSPKPGKLFNLFNSSQNNNSVSSSSAAASSSGGIQLDDEDFKELQQHLAAHKGQLRTNATLRVEMAKFLDAKRKEKASETTTTTTTATTERKKGWALLKQASQTISRLPLTNEPKTPSVSDSSPLKLGESVLFSESNYSESSLPYPEEANHKTGFNQAPDMTMALKGGDDDDYESDKKKKKKKREKKQRRKVFQALADEKIPNEDGLRQRRKKKKEYDFLKEKFPDLETSDSTFATELSLPSPPPLHDSLSALDIEDNEKFIDGLVFFAGEGERNERRIRKLVLKRTASGISTDSCI